MGAIANAHRDAVARLAWARAWLAAGTCRLAACRAGSVGPMLGVLMAVMVLCVGAAIDVGRWMQAKTQSQKALSAAALAGVRMLQISGGDRVLAIGSARRTFEENLGAGLAILLDTLAFDVGPDGASFTAEASGATPTTLLRIAGIERLPVRGELATAITAGAAGTSFTTSYEVALAVDLSDAVSDGMLDQIKLAMTDLVDIVVWRHQSAASARVALVPFADTVDPGPGIERFTGELRPGLCTTPGCQRLAFQARDASRCGASSSAAGCAVRVHSAGRCIAERSAAEPFTDASPSIAHFPLAYPSPTGLCTPVGRAEPLSADGDALHRAIASLAKGGTSAPHLGMAWAWYMLSPEWAELWPDASRPAPYAELSLRASGNRPKLRKIAVLVQSASETVQHCQGVDDRVIACNSPNGSAIEQTRRLCDAMHRSGIMIYVVGIGIDGNRRLDAVLRDSCAGREDAFYAVRSGSELRQAFRDIALQISPAVETH